MPADYTQLDAAILEGVETATQVEGAADSVIAILAAVEEQAVARLVADNALDQANTDRAVADVRAVFARNKASAQKIADAITARNPPTPPGPTDPSVPTEGRRR